MKNSVRLIALTLLSGSCAAVWQAEAQFQTPPPPEQKVIQSIPVAEIQELDDDERFSFFNQRIALHCNTCHSNEMIQQQKLNLTQWQAEVQKMVGWGSTLPKDYVNLMGEHLSRLYPADVPREAPRVEPTTLLAENAPRDTASVSDGELNNTNAARMYKEQCANCHGDQGQGAELGIRLTNRPMLVHPDAFEQIVNQGRGIMPAFNKHLKSEELNTIRRWLLSRSFSFNNSNLRLNDK